MSNGKTCGECRYYEHPAGQCAKVIEYNNCHITDKACEYFDPKVITNGEKLWNYGYDAVITFAKTWNEKFSCWAEAEAWLNSPADDCVKQNGNHDTQAGLCVADNTESEVSDE